MRAWCTLKHGTRFQLLAWGHEQAATLCMSHRSRGRTIDGQQHGVATEDGKTNSQGCLGA